MKGEARNSRDGFDEGRTLISQTSNEAGRLLAWPDYGHNNPVAGLSKSVPDSTAEKTKVPRGGELKWPCSSHGTAAIRRLRHETGQW